MPVALNLDLFLHNVRAALDNQQYEHAQFLLDAAITSMCHISAPPPLFPLDVSIGLHRGRVRAENEDCVLAMHGVVAETQEALGLFVVADGMGGHAHGQQAAHLAIQTILEQVFPCFIQEHAPVQWESLLAESIRQANQVIYRRNQSLEPLAGKRAPMTRMGTTVTAVLLVGKTAYIANVGDSRTYHWCAQGLRRITRDHSLVAQLLARGILSDEEELYTHRKRNEITRAVGTEAAVEVDTFVLPLQAESLLLLCSDGLWEMTRDREIEKVVASPWVTAASMTSQLVCLANDGGGADNIGCIVVQWQKRSERSALETTTHNPMGALTSLTISS